MARPRNTELDGLLADAGEILDIKPVKREFRYKEEEPETYTFELVGDYPVRDGVKVFPASFSLPNTDTVIDPESGKYRTIRYLVGVTGIYLDDQKDIDDKAVKRLTPKRFQFDHGRLIVDAKDKTQLDFLMLSGRNESVKEKAQGCYTMYRLVDTRKAEQAKLEDIKLRRKAAAAAEDAEDESMLEHADYLGIRLTTDNGQKKSIEGIRADYIIYAQSNPTVFFKSLDNPLTKSYVKIRKAITEGIITITHVKGQANWNDTKAVIVNFPEGAAEVDFLAKHALTDAGKSFKERLWELL